MPSFGKYILTLILIIFAYKINRLRSPMPTVRLMQNNKITRANPAMIMGTMKNRLMLEQ